MQCLALHLGVNKVGGSVFRCLDFLTELPATCSTVHCCCQAHLCARAIAPFLHNHHLPSMPCTCSGKPKTSQVSFTVTPHGAENDPVSLTVDLAGSGEFSFVVAVYDWWSHPIFPKSHQQAAWCLEIPCQLSGMEQPQYDFTHSRLLQQTHSRAWGEQGAL